MFDVLVFRLGDSKVPMQPGEKGYLDMFTQPFTIADIRSRYGGGKFRLILEKNSRYKNTHDIEIEGAPIYDMRRERPGGSPAAAHGNPSGAGDTSAIGQQLITILREEMARNREAGGGNGVSEATIEMMSKAAGSAVDMVKESVGKGGGGSILETITVLKELGLIGQPAPAPAVPNNNVMDTIRLLKELGVIGAPALAAAVDPSAQLTQFLTVFEKLDALRGTAGGAAGKRDWKETLAEKALDHVPELIGVFKETRDSNLQLAAQRRGLAEAQRDTATALRGISPAAPNGAAQSPHAAPQGAESTRSAPVSAAPMRTVRLDGSGEPASIETVVDNARGFDGSNPAFVEWIKRRLVELVKIGQGGESIVDWLDGSLPGYSDQLSAASAEMVTSFMRADPILAEAAEHPRWPEVLAEAREYLKENATPLVN